MYGTLSLCYMRSILNMGTYHATPVIFMCVPADIFPFSLLSQLIFIIMKSKRAEAGSVRWLRLLDSTQYKHIYNHFHKQENVLLIDDHNISYHYQ